MIRHQIAINVVPFNGTRIGCEFYFVVSGDGFVLLYGSNFSSFIVKFLLSNIWFIYYKRHRDLSQS